MNLTRQQFKAKVSAIRKGSRSSRVKPDIITRLINDNYQSISDDNYVDYLLLCKNLKSASLCDEFGPLSLNENVYVDLDEHNTNYIEAFEVVSKKFATWRRVYILSLIHI